MHRDVKYLSRMQDESSKRYVFVTIDRATRWVFVQLKTNKTAANAQASRKGEYKTCTIRITKLLTDNDKEFTDRLFVSRERDPSCNQEVPRTASQAAIWSTGRSTIWTSFATSFSIYRHGFLFYLSFDIADNDPAQPVDRSTTSRPSGRFY